MAPLGLALASPVATSPDYQGNCQSPRWSPDGSQLAYEVNYHERRVVDLHLWRPGEKPRQVAPHVGGAGGATAGFTTAGGSGQVVHELAWQPGPGGTFAYSASGPDRDYDIYLESGRALAPARGADGGATWSPDGRRLAFTSARTGQGDLYLLDMSTPDAQPRRLTGDEDASELYSTWSPDGGMLAFVGHGRTGDSLYLLTDTFNPAPKRITSLGHTQTRPRFSPDGAWLAFYSNHLDPERFDLYVMAATGGQPRVVSKGVVLNSGGPAWTPDGRLLFVSDDDARFDPLMVVDAARSGSPVAVKTGTVGNGDHDVVRAPDGRTYLALAAQGTTGGAERDFKRIYVVLLP